MFARMFMTHNVITFIKNLGPAKNIDSKAPTRTRPEPAQIINDNHKSYTQNRQKIIIQSAMSSFEQKLENKRSLLSGRSRNHNIL